MKFIEFVHIITLKNATNAQLKKYAIYGAVICVFGCTAAYFHAQYRVKQTEYTNEAFQIFKNNERLMELIGPFRIGNISFGDGISTVEDKFAKIRVYITGKHANGTLHYEASKSDDDDGDDDNKWTLRKLEFHFSDVAGGKVRLIKESTDAAVTATATISDEQHTIEATNATKDTSKIDNNSVTTDDKSKS